MTNYKAKIEYERKLYVWAMRKNMPVKAAQHKSTMEYFIALSKEENAQ